MLRTFVIACLLAVLPASALAASQTAIGPRIGFSTGPDQFVIGGQLSVGEIAPHVTFDPSVDIGFGDNRTLIGLNLDLHYLFNTSGDWRPYLGGGVGINNVNYDNDHYGDLDSDTLVGGSVVLGAITRRPSVPMFAELKLAIGDGPDLKLLVGWLFKS